MHIRGVPIELGCACGRRVTCLGQDPAPSCWTARRFVEGNPDLAVGPELDRFIEQSHQDLAAAMGALDTSLRSISA